MLKERLQTLRDHLASLPAEKFIYRTFFSQWPYDDKLYPIERGVVPEASCGTAACVAGWALMLFAPGIEISRGAYNCDPKSVFQRAQVVLDLTVAEAVFLFLEVSSRANREDAIQRIDHLLAGKPVIEYVFRTESWC